MARNEIVMMTEEQWKEKVKHDLKRKIKEGFQWILFGIAMVAVPIGMVAHWIVFGYGH